MPPPSEERRDEAPVLGTRSAAMVADRAELRQRTIDALKLEADPITRLLFDWLLIEVAEQGISPALSADPTDPKSDAEELRSLRFSVVDSHQNFQLFRDEIIDLQRALRASSALTDIQILRLAAKTLHDGPTDSDRQELLILCGSDPLNSSLSYSSMISGVGAQMLHLKGKLEESATRVADLTRQLESAQVLNPADLSCPLPIIWGQIYGVEISADVVAMILFGDPLTHPDCDVWSRQFSIVGLDQPDDSAPVELLMLLEESAIEVDEIVPTADTDAAIRPLAASTSIEGEAIGFTTPESVPLDDRRDRAVSSALTELMGVVDVIETGSGYSVVQAMSLFSRWAETQAKDYDLNEIARQVSIHADHRKTVIELMRRHVHNYNRLTANMDRQEYKRLLMSALQPAAAKKARVKD